VKPVVLFHVQHLLGIGHLRRAAILGRAILAAGFDLCFVSGGAPAPAIALSGAKLIQLPPAVAADVRFSHLLDEVGRPIDDAWRDQRRRQLLAAFESARPQLILIEMFPFGRRQFAFELLPLLDAARARALPVAVSLRDILVAKNNPGRIAETIAIVNSRVDRVLVHSDPALVRLEASFPGAGEIADRLAYTGYVAESRRTAATPANDEILVSTGGGAVGGPLLRAALAARPLTRAAGMAWRLIVGPNMSAAEFAALAASAPTGVTIERFRTDFPELLAGCRLSLSQAGYNTVMDILAARARALVVPFAEAAENEQSLRARLLADRGLIGCLEAEAAADPRRLAAAIDAALERPRPPAWAVDLNGAAETARQLKAMLE
jgi:predicted glycosyltransferase